MTAVPMMPRNPESLRHLRLACCCVLALAFLQQARAQTGPLEDLSAFPSGTLTIGGAKAGRPAGGALVAFALPAP